MEEKDPLSKFALQAIDLMMGLKGHPGQALRIDAYYLAKVIESGLVEMRGDKHCSH